MNVHQVDENQWGNTTVGSKPASLTPKGRKACDICVSLSSVSIARYMISCSKQEVGCPTVEPDANMYHWNRPCPVLASQVGHVTSMRPLGHATGASYCTDHALSPPIHKYGKNYKHLADTRRWEFSPMSRPTKKFRWLRASRRHSILPLDSSRETGAPMRTDGLGYRSSFCSLFPATFRFGAALRCQDMILRISYLDFL